MRGDDSRVQSQRRLLAISTAGLLFGAASVAQADVHLAMGTRFEPYRYTAASFPNAQKAADGRQLVAPNQGFQTTSLAPYFGAFFAQRYGVILGLDLGWARLNGDYKATKNPMPTDPAETDSFFQFGISLGAKLYLREIKKDRIAPYVYVDIFKYLASVSTNNTGVPSDQASAQADLASPVGGSLAVGAEYFLGTGFSIGAEIFGLRVSHVSGNYNFTDPANPAAPAVAHDAGFTQLSMYSGLTLNYRFQVQASMKATDEPEEDKRRPSPGPSAPPPSLPPPSPEAVD